MNRVAVIGCPGSGKTHFSKQLAKITNLPLIHLDHYYDHESSPADKEAKREEWIRLVSDFVAKKRWIIDGNYKSTFDLRLPRADTIVLLDYPRRVALYRLFKRRLQYHGRRRDDMPEGWKEKIDWEFFTFVWNFKKVDRTRLYQKVTEHSSGKDTIIFHTPKEAQSFLTHLKKAQIKSQLSV